jgi:dihydroxyacetone kinase
MFSCVTPEQRVPQEHPLREIRKLHALAGTIFIHNLVGAAAAEGKSLADIAAMGRAAVESPATMGVSFSAGTAPAVGRPSFELSEHEMELGLGIHGEPGVKRTQLQTADKSLIA